MIKVLRVAVVSGGIPNPTTGGGALTAWSATQALLRAGHDVVVYALQGLHTSPSARQVEDQVGELEKAGARVRIVTAGNGPSRPAKESRWRATLWPGIEQDYPACLLGARLRGSSGGSPRRGVCLSLRGACGVTRRVRARVWRGRGQPSPGVVRGRRRRPRSTACASRPGARSSPACTCRDI